MLVAEHFTERVQSNEGNPLHTNNNIPSQLISQKEKLLRILYIEVDAPIFTKQMRSEVLTLFQRKETMAAKASPTRILGNDAEL